MHEENRIIFRKLGNTGLDVSTIGFGTWQLAGGRWKARSTNESIKILRFAHQRGINIFDAAIVYGQYESQIGQNRARSLDLLRKSFRAIRDQAYFCIKVGQCDELSHRNSFSPSTISRQIKQCLRQLGTSYIDICLLHAPSISAIKQGRAIAVLEALREFGYVRFIGYALENQPEHVRAAMSQNIDVLMIQYNLIDSECGLELDQASENGIGVLACGPYKRGYLCGKYRAIDDLPLEDDYWAWNAKHNPEKVRQLMRAVEQFSIMYGSGKELRYQCLRFILSKAAVASVVVGHRAVEEIEENIKLSVNVHLEELKELESSRART